MLVNNILLVERIEYWIRTVTKEPMCSNILLRQSIRLVGLVELARQGTLRW
jgi:hypothetical protein